MQNKLALVITAAAAALSACTSMPDVTYQYYHTKSATTFSVTQTLQCIKRADNSSGKTTRKPKNEPAVTAYKALDVTTAIVTPSTNYFSDYNEPATPINARDIDGFLSDTNVSFTFTEDGRLSSMNAATTGEGETALKSAISLGTAIAAVGLAAGLLAKNGELPRRPTVSDVCKALANYPNSDKLALTFTRVIDVGRAAKEWLDAEADAAKKNSPMPTTPVFPLNDGSSGINVSDPQLYRLLQSMQVNLPQIRVKLGDIQPNARVASYNASTSGDVVKLDLQDTAGVRLDYDRNGENIGANSNLVVVPLAKSIYQVAIPKGQPFGNANVSLTLSGAGAITTLGYGKTSGSAGAMNVANSALTAATPAATTPPPG